MQTPNKTIAVINSSGRQAASVIRVATAVGYKVRAQLRSLDGFIATEVATNPNVTVLVGELYTRSPSHHGSPAHPGDLHSQRTGGSESSTCSEREDVTRKGPEPVAGVGVNHALISELFEGAELAFINTTFYGDELQIGMALLDAAKAAGIQHYVYSSMPDHSAYDPDWPALPLWAAKHQVEDYVRASGVPATFVYTGIYNNNFTGLIYPLFCMELQTDGSFVWQAPFHRHAKLPWLDAEHDMGPAILQIFKDGPAKWANRRIALAYEMLTPLEACEQFSRGVGRPVRYVQAPIDIKVKIPTGYRQQLEALERLFTMGGDDASKQPPYFGDAELDRSCPAQAMELWEGPRLLEEYAREVFPVEEHANGLRWMMEEDWEEDDQASGVEDDGDDDGGEDEGLEMKARKRDQEKWLA
jgi:hypothetical protein